MLISQLSIFDSLGSVLSLPLLLGFFGWFDFAIDELISPVVPLNKVTNESKSLLQIFVESFINFNLELKVRIQGNLDIFLGNLFTRSFFSLLGFLGRLCLKSDGFLNGSLFFSLSSTELEL